MAERHATPEESFAARTERRGDCLIWTGWTNVGGYGTVCIGDQKDMLVHRYAWEREHGPIPEGVMIDHRYHCDKACCEVTHLRKATRSQNGLNRSGPTSHNRSSGVRNVYRKGKGWVFQMKVGDTVYRKHGFKTADEAAAFADGPEGRIKYAGDYAGRG